MRDRTPTPLEQRIIERIQASPQQRITFADYMNWVLYEPDLGYYAANRVNIGAGGDFFTSPHLGQDFGELLALQFLEMWQRLGQPERFTLVEMGAGQGLVAADVLKYLRSHQPDFFAVLDYIIVEQAAAMITEQQHRLKAWVETWGRLTWRTLTEISPDSITGCCFANELVDAFPVHQLQLHQGQLWEVYVTLLPAGSDSTEVFTEVLGELSTPQILDYLRLNDLDLTSPLYPEGYRTEVNLAALNWMAIVAQRLHRGYCLTIDYGYTANQYYSPARCQGTLQCYYQHAVGNQPYLHVGLQDLTAHVNFTALERQGKVSGLEPLGFTQQAMFLMALGLGDRLTINNATPDLADLNTVLRRREALHQLINPLGLGGFGVLLQGKGLQPEAQQQPLKGFSV